MLIQSRPARLLLVSALTAEYHYFMLGMHLWLLLVATTALGLHTLGIRKSWPLDAAILAAALIIFNTLLLSLIGALSAIGLCVMLVLEMVGLVFIVWPKLGVRWPSPASIRTWRPARPRCRLDSIFVATMAVAIVGVLLFAQFMIGWNPGNADSLSYHIPRAYFWLEQGRVANLPVDDFRWNEFPPNGSILILWTMAADSFPALKSLPQYFGAYLIGTSIWLTVRALSASRSAAALGVLVFLGCPALYLQLPTSSNDLMIGGLIVAMAFYLVKIGQDVVWYGAISWHNLLFAAATCGLGTGTKHTFLLISPVLLVCALALVWRLRFAFSLKPGRLAAQAGIAMTVILALGSFSYILNQLTFGHPLYSENAKAILTIASNSNMSLLESGYLAAYQTTTFHGLDNFFDPGAPDTWDATAERISHVLGFSLGSLPPVANGLVTAKPDYDFGATGYGIAGGLSFTAGLVGLAVFPFMTWRTRQFRDVAVSCIAAGFVLWMSLFLLSKNWTPSHPRYFISALPLAMIVLVCAVDRLRQAKYILFVPLLLCVVSTMLWMTHSSPWMTEARHFKETGLQSIDVQWAGDYSAAARALARALPAGTEITLYGKLDAMVYALIVYAPSLTYHLGLAEGDALQEISAPAVVEKLGPTGPNAFPLPRWSAYPQLRLIHDDLPAFVKRNIDLYDMKIIQGGSILLGVYGIETISGLSRTSAQLRDGLAFVLPTFLVDGAWEYHQPVLSNVLTSSLIAAVNCDDKPANWRLEKSKTDDATLIISSKTASGATDRPTICRVFYAHELTTQVGRQGTAEIRLAPPALLKSIE
jgi:hypothetical protein